MRIGIIANSLTGGGAERQAALWAGIIAGWSDAELEVLALHAKDRLYALPAGVAVTLARKRHPADVLRVARAITGFAGRFDVLVSFQPYPALFRVGRRRPPLLIVTGDDPRRHWDVSRWPNRLIDAAFRSAAAASVPTPQLIDTYRELGVRTRGPWLSVPNIVDPEGYVAAPPGEKRGVLFVGRLEEQKDPLLAVDAAIAAGAPLTVLGEGSLKDAVARRAAGHDVRLHPFTSRPWELYARHRVLVVSSRYEPFGNVLVESLAAGTPVVSVDCDFGPRFVLEGARFSTVVAERSPQALGAALRAALDRPYDDEERAECAEIAARFSCEAIAPLVRDAIERTLAVGA